MNTIYLHLILVWKVSRRGEFEAKKKKDVDVKALCEDSIITFNGTDMIFIDVPD